MAEADRQAGKDVPESGPAPVWTKLRWPKPVYVGDTITFGSTFTAVEDDPKRADWGIATTADEGVNQEAAISRRGGHERLAGGFFLGLVFTVLLVFRVVFDGFDHLDLCGIG